jgi:hypothetical protein
MTATIRTSPPTTPPTTAPVVLELDPLERSWLFSSGSDAVVERAAVLDDMGTNFISATAPKMGTANVVQALGAVFSRLTGIPRSFPEQTRSMSSYHFRPRMNAALRVHRLSE